MQVGVRLLCLKTQSLQQLQAKTLSVKTWNWPHVSALGICLLAQGVRTLSTVAAALPRSMVIYFFLSAMLAHYAAVWQADACCMLCPTPSPFIPSILCDSLYTWKKPWAKRVKGEAYASWNNYEHHLCPEPGKPAHLDLCLPVDIDVVLDRGQCPPDIMPSSHKTSSTFEIVLPSMIWMAVSVVLHNLSMPHNLSIKPAEQHQMHSFASLNSGL